MTHPAQALRAAIRAALTADPGLVALIGPDRIHDEPPRAAEPPYITFGETELRDWSDGSVRGHRHTLTLVVWSRQGGDAEALAILERCEAVIDAGLPAIPGLALVLLRVAETRLARPDRDGLRRAVLKLTALTEPH